MDCRVSLVRHLAAAARGTPDLQRALENGRSRQYFREAGHGSVCGRQWPPASLEKPHAAACVCRQVREYIGLRERDDDIEGGCTDRTFQTGRTALVKAEIVDRYGRRQRILENSPCQGIRRAILASILDSAKHPVDKAWAWGQGNRGVSRCELGAGSNHESDFGAAGLQYGPEKRGLTRRHAARIDDEADPEFPVRVHEGGIRRHRRGRVSGSGTVSVRCRCAT